MIKVRLLLCGHVHVSNVAKCNLDKVILEAGEGAMPFAEAPLGLYTQVLSL